MHTLTPTHTKSILLKVITTHCIEKYNNVFGNIKKNILVVDKHFVWYLQLVCISLSSSKLTSKTIIYTYYNEVMTR